MTTARYSEEQRQTFVERAAQIGITPAMKELGYPGTVATASQWCQKLGVKVTLSALQAHAASIGQFYGHQEKLALCQKLLDETYDILVHGERCEDDETVLLGDDGLMYITPKRKPVTAATLGRLSGIVQRTIQTMELLEGRVTSRIEQVSVDASDIELREMIERYRVQNAETLQQLRQEP